MKKDEEKSSPVKLCVCVSCSTSLAQHPLLNNMHKQMLTIIIGHSVRQNYDCIAGSCFLNRSV